ncbi:MAG TPA: FAD-binding protein [Puia sp.]|nr:FAD-binding protein [Puia sp.]
MNTRNWAGNIEYSTPHIHHPRSIEAIQTLVRQLKKGRVLGTRHCFNRIADSEHQLISTAGLNRIVSLDPVAQTVTVEGGIKYGELAPWLDEKGYALHNLASLPHISVAGSIATATHGSGMDNGNLATAVTALELVTGDGEIRTVDKKDMVRAAAVNLGVLGVVTKVTLAIQPKYQIRQTVYEHLPMTELTTNFKGILSAGYSVSLFTDWRQDAIDEVWVKSMAPAGGPDRSGKSSVPDQLFGARAATQPLHPIAGTPAENCTEQMGIPGPWHERLPHFRMGFTPSSGTELQSEYFVPFHHGVEAVLAIQKLGSRISPHLFISEIRTIAADELWLSPNRHQDSVAFHFTWRQDWPAVSRLLPLIENELAPFQARPHWGKLFTMPPATLQSRYEKLNDFKKLAAELDPEGKFRNEFVATYVY